MYPMLEENWEICLLPGPRDREDVDRAVCVSARGLEILKCRMDFFLYYIYLVHSGMYEYCFAFDVVFKRVIAFAFRMGV